MNLIGQANAHRYLTQGLRSGRLSPSLLFVGPEGVGKKSAALELAKALFCLETPDICNKCGACKRVAGETHPDLVLVNFALQAALLREKPESQNSLKIETIRHLDNFLSLRSLEGSRRMAVIHHAHKMTIEAANALLKTLEEPPAQAQLVLITNDERNLPSTILSRCAVLRFSLISTPLISQWLQQHRHLDATKADDLAERSGGSFTQAEALIEAEPEEVDLSSMSLEEFFDSLSASTWRKEGRARAIEAINFLIQVAERKLRRGDVSQAQALESLLKARQQVDRFVSPRLVLENLYLKLNPSFKTGVEL